MVKNSKKEEDVDKKEVIRNPIRKYSGTVISPFNTSKKSYKVGDVFKTPEKRSLDYLKSIQKIK